MGSEGNESFDMSINITISLKNLEKRLGIATLVINSG